MGTQNAPKEKPLHLAMAKSYLFKIYTGYR